MIRIFPSFFSGTLSAPPSVAHAQRLLFAAAVSNSPTTLYNVPACEDIRTTILCLEALGSTLERKGKNTLTIQPFIKTKPVPRVDFDFGSCAAAARYTLAIAAAYGIQVECTASESLKRRPLFPLASRMAVRGATFSGFSFPLTMQGRLEGGEYDFDGRLSAQFASSILMAAPVLSGPSTVQIHRPVLMGGQIDITIKVLQQFGITVEPLEDGYAIPGRQVYTSPGTTRVHNDWSLAAMWLTAGALSQGRGGSISCTDLPADSPQGYRNLTEMHSQLITDFKDITVDASDCPALVPLIAIVAAARSGAVHLSGAPQLHHKETDRLKTVAAILRGMGADMWDTPDGLESREGSFFDYPEDVLIDCQGDANITMSFALAAPLLKKPFLLQERAVDKTWPGFWNQYRALGGKFEILENPIDS
ncbi:MAG: hypothetical protein PHG30_01705 [Eubacteriales bacterium]|nr:hypothetical protein [Eubacteriales bacterium]